MTIKDITNRLRDVQRIQVADPDHAADEIVPGIMKSGVLFYDNRTPVIKMPLHYQRIKSADAEALIFNLLDEKSQRVVPFKEIKEATKRLCYIPELQVDLTEEFWKGQLLVNLVHGVYDIMKKEIVPVRNDYKFDYFINIRYIPKCTLEDAPTVKH